MVSMLVDADWCLQSDVMTDSRLQAAAATPEMWATDLLRSVLGSPSRITGFTFYFADRDTFIIFFPLLAYLSCQLC